MTKEAQLQPTAYQLRKQKGVKGEVAQEFFSRDFVTRAFEAANFPPSQSSRRDNLRLDEDIISAITTHGWEELAKSCMTYLLLVEVRKPRADDTTFIGLITQIRDAAEQIGRAADTLAAQVSAGESATAQLFSQRRRALHEMGRALFGDHHDIAIDDIDVTALRSDFFGTVSVRHDLSRIAKLYDAADRVLADFRRRQRARDFAISQKDPPIRNGVDLIKEEFIGELALIYTSVTGEPARASKGSDPERTAPPFCRFLYRVFAEFKILGFEPATSRDYKAPEVDTVKRILKRLKD